MTRLYGILTRCIERFLGEIFVYHRITYSEAWTESALFI